MKNLYKKMHAVMVETESIEKDTVVGTGKNQYRAVGEAQVLNVIKPLFKKHGLMIFPVDIEAREEQFSYESTNSYKGTDEQKNRLMTQLVVKYKIVDIDTGEYEILATVGNGADSQDKGSGKAMTYALKVVLQKTFLLFSGEDTDNDHSDDLDKKMTLDKKTTPQKIQPAQLNIIIDLLSAINDKDLEGVILKGYKIKSLEDLTFKDASGAIQRLKEIAEGDKK